MLLLPLAANTAHDAAACRPPSMTPGRPMPWGIGPHRHGHDGLRRCTRNHMVPPDMHVKLPEANRLGPPAQQISPAKGHPASGTISVQRTHALTHSRQYHSTTVRPALGGHTASRPRTARSHQGSVLVAAAGIRSSTSRHDIRTGHITSTCTCIPALLVHGNGHSHHSDYRDPPAVDLGQSFFFSPSPSRSSDRQRRLVFFASPTCQHAEPWLESIELTPHRQMRWPQ